MRRLLLFALLCSLVAAPAALARHRATGDGVLELQAASGTVSIGTAAKPARGALWGQMDGGTLKVLDPLANDGKVFVSGYDHRTYVDTDAGRLWTYTGRDLHYRVTGGTYKLWFKGSGIDLTAVGVGVARLSGDPTAADPGSYAVDDAAWTPLPIYVAPGQFLAVPFGDQTSAAQP